MLGWRTEEQRLAWLTYQGTRHGFEIADAIAGTSTVQRLLGKERYADVSARVDVTTFQGVLVVTDPPRFAHACQTGIGRAKAFGCGLLLTQPA